MSKLKQIIRRLLDILLVPRHRRGRRPWFSLIPTTDVPANFASPFPPFLLLSFFSPLLFSPSFYDSKRGVRFNSRNRNSALVFTSRLRVSRLRCLYWIFFFLTTSYKFIEARVLRGKPKLGGWKFCRSRVRWLGSPRSLIQGVNIDDVGVASLGLDIYIYLLSFVCIYLSLVNKYTMDGGINYRPSLISTLFSHIRDTKGTTFKQV